MLVADAAAPSTQRLADAIRSAGADARACARLGDAELTVRGGRAAVVVLDVAGAGAEPALAATVRRWSPACPLAAWVPTASTGAAADWLEAGADEALYASMGDRELVARLVALTRRAPGRAVVLDVGALRVDQERGEATWQGRRLALTARERDVLHALAASVGATVRREALYRQVWGYAMARGDRTVDVNVKRLRDKLANGVGPPVTIEIEPGVGYRLIVADAAVTAL